MQSFYLFTTFTSEVKQMWHMYKYVLNTLLDKIYSCKHIKMSCLFDSDSEKKEPVKESLPVKYKRMHKDTFHTETQFAKGVGDDLFVDSK